MIAEMEHAFFPVRAPAQAIGHQRQPIAGFPLLLRFPYIQPGVLHHVPQLGHAQGQAALLPIEIIGKQPVVIPLPKGHRRAIRIKMGVAIAGGIQHAQQPGGHRRIARGRALHIRPLQTYFPARSNLTTGNGGTVVGPAGLIIHVFSVRAPALPQARMPEVSIQRHTAELVQQAALSIHDGHIGLALVQIGCAQQHPARSVRRFRAHRIIRQQAPMILYLKHLHFCRSPFFFGFRCFRVSISISENPAPKRSQL